MQRLNRRVLELRNRIAIPLRLTSSSGPSQDDRLTIAPWIPVGQYERGLLSHLGTTDILRSLFVLHLCSYDFIVDRNVEIFKLSQKFGRWSDWMVRKTFFKQFVGGESMAEMRDCVEALHKRGLRLMVLPVLEADLEDKVADARAFEENLRTLEGIIRMTASLGKQEGVFQLKPTAIMSPATLDSVSRAISQHYADSNPSVGNQARLVEAFAESVEYPGSLPLKLDRNLQDQLIAGLRRADYLVKLASELSVSVLVDAEFYSCKPAISTLALALMARHNGSGHHVGNTIQGYLKEAVSGIRSELELTTKEIGVSWYGKIVRGAYMDRERLLARSQGLASPICDSYEDSSDSYNTAVRTVLEHLGRNKGSRSHLVVATHNEKSIRLAAQGMRDLGITNQDRLVSFAQIYGMADYLSTPLVLQGYNVYKSAPYGPMALVFPYLGRRAAENRAVLQGAREERLMLLKELRSRLH